MQKMHGDKGDSYHCIIQARVVSETGKSKDRMKATNLKPMFEKSEYG
jgi:hypothetical protein